MSKDPTGETGDGSLYGFVRGAPVAVYDVLGLMTPRRFWDRWGEDDRRGWFGRFKAKHGSSICAAARDHCIPAELLAAIIANEQIDYELRERLGEWLGFGDSVGLAQITVDTAIRYRLTDCNPSDFRNVCIVGARGATVCMSAEDQYLRCVRSVLQSDAGSIEASARLMSRYLDDLCSRARSGSLSRSFQQLAGGCDVSDFCCRSAGKGCATADVPACLMAALAATWNNDIAITGEEDIPGGKPNADAHAGNASLIDGYLTDFCD